MIKDSQKIPRYYWDSNVFLSLINGPPDRLPIIEAILDDCAQGKAELYTSILSITEVAFAECEKSSRRLDKKIEEKINKLWYPPSPVKLVEISNFVIWEAKDLLRNAMQASCKLKPPDAIHLATAKRVCPTEIHTYDLEWDKHSVMLGCKILLPQINRILFPHEEDQAKT